MIVQWYPQRSEILEAFMSSAAIATIVKMTEDLPESAQQQVVEHLGEYLEDLRDEIRWDLTFERTQDKLVEAARRAKDYNATRPKNK